MTVSIQIVPGSQADAMEIARLSNMAASGTSFVRWQQLAEGTAEDPWNKGAECVRRDVGEFSYRHCYLLKTAEGKVAGLVNSFLMIEENADLRDEPAWLPYAQPFQEFEGSVVGNWYINFLAVKEEYRGQGLASHLLDHALKLAKDSGVSAVNLVVLGSKTSVIRLYERYGFSIQRTLPAISMGDQFIGDSWHLMEKQL
ncbi:GNAT family N-acetyltransferase [Sneathiella limimaris]|uniref:GNAT family N-acetyltransferase n=1 Tax=Sneathiella limimaris TaxID=1964213 RepID=UPI001F0FD949|nr:N-acetyltransferase [Sneathiella limimaris]